MSAAQWHQVWHGARRGPACGHAGRGPPPHWPHSSGALGWSQEGKSWHCPVFKGAGPPLPPRCLLSDSQARPSPRPVICHIGRHGSTAAPSLSRGLRTSFQRQNQLWPKQRTTQAVGDAYGFIMTSCSQARPCERGARLQLHSGCLCHRRVACGRQALQRGCRWLQQQFSKAPANVTRSQRWLLPGLSCARRLPLWGRSRTRAERSQT